MPKPKSKPALSIPKLMYGREDAAFALSVSVRTIDYMISDQRLRTRRMGRRTLIPAADVERVAATILQSDMLQGVARKRT